jgi:hypothetical protein
MVPFPMDAEGMQPFILPPGPFPMPGMDLSAPPPADPSAAPHPAFYPFPFAGLPQFVPGTTNAEGDKPSTTPSQEVPSEGHSADLGSVSSTLDLSQDSGIAPSQLECPGPESTEM